ncbi:MAG: SdrD B-like domain-containing protein [Patescibacteria group bacterium]|nr:SdrD B-like domain-containing protein [Patescibacteria group bacterium]
MKKAIIIASVFLAYIVLFTLFVLIYFYDLPGQRSYLGTTVRPNEGAQLRKLPLKTCSGEGDLFLYEGSNPFQPIMTSFEAEGTEVLVFTKSIDSLDFQVNGRDVTPGNVADKVYSMSVAYGSTISVDGEANSGARSVQGFLVQDANSPVYDVSTFQFIIDDKRSNEMFLIPGVYTYAVFDKYTINALGAGIDDRRLTVKVEGQSGIVKEKTYRSPYPDGTQGAVIDNFEITSQGNYMFSIDTEDSVYWALVECPICGDGEMEKDEQCDDGDNNGEVCTPDYGGECEYCSDVCELKTVQGPYCGDGDVNGQEQCDDGFGNGEVCIPAYGESCTYCSLNCETQNVGGPYCGDGNVDEGEECDGDQGVGPNQTCSNECTLVDVPHCGDGNVDSGEECDDGNTEDGDGCSSTCSKPDKCNVICTSSIGCDGGLGCFDGMCRNSSCSSESDCICASCGDGNLDLGEDCDDGNNRNGDGCSALCKKEEEEEEEGDCDGSIGNFIWDDANGDGVQDKNEPGIPDVKVCAHDGNDKICDKTNTTGRYKIKGLCEGKYDVRVRSTDLENYAQTYDPDSKLDHKTDVKLKGDNDHHTKADFGYRLKKVAPAAGINFPALMMISVVITAVVLIVYELMRKKKHSHR